MAGNLPVPSGVEVKLVWNLGTSPHALNILHYANPQNTIINQALANSLDTSIKAAFSSSNLALSMATTFSLHHIEIRSMTSNANPWYVASGAAVPGAGTGNPLPAATSFVLTFKTGLRGRSYNGRIYLCGWTEDANDAAGGCTQASATAAINFMASLNAAFTGAPNLMTPSILSRWTTVPGAGVATERNPPILTPITSTTNRDLRWDVQRRRATPGI